MLKLTASFRRVEDRLRSADCPRPVRLKLMSRQEARSLVCCRFHSHCLLLTGRPWQQAGTQDSSAAQAHQGRNVASKPTQDRTRFGAGSTGLVVATISSGCSWMVFRLRERYVLLGMEAVTASTEMNARVTILRHWVQMQDYLQEPSSSCGCNTPHRGPCC